jgi:hypothetical protein
MVTLSEYKDRKLLKVIQKQKNEFIKKNDARFLC